MAKKQSSRAPRTRRTKTPNSFKAEIEHMKELIEAEIEARLDDEIPRDLIVRNMALRAARLKRLETTLKAVEKLVDIYEKPPSDDMLEADLLHSEELD